MKFLFACILSISALANALGAKPQNAKIQHVTVYLQGAHLYYSEPISVQPGNNEFIFENISPFVVDATLQASCKGATLMEISHRVKYKEKKIVVKLYDQAIKDVLDSMEEVNYGVTNIQNHLRVLDQEEKMLLNNRLIRGDSPKDSLALLRDAMQFTREKLNEILEQKLLWDKRKDKANKLLAKLNERYQQLTLLQNGTLEEPGNQAIPVQQILVSIFAEQAGVAQVNFNYFVQNAGWVPNYDMLANSSTSSLQLKYFAHVSQSTGLKWNDAALTLSTSNPMERNVKPVLSPWLLGFQDYRQYKQLQLRSKNAAMPMQKESLSTRVEQDDASAVQLNEEKLLTEYIQISENMLRTEYEIKLKYDIESDGKPHKVLIRQQDVPMQLAFAAVPKMCSDAFLMGRITAWEDLNIIPGSARIYFDGSYVGETYLNNQSTTDTLDLNLGKDKSIVMSRKKVKEKTKVKTLENERVETRSIEIVVRNTKGIPIDVLLEDQIPVVTGGTNEIKVTLLEGNGANLDEPSGMLKWNFKLGAKDSKKITFTYEIRYPKNKPVYGL